MADIEKVENVVTNGISSVLSSPDSVDVLIHPDSSETSASDLPSTSGYRPMINSTTQSSLASNSEGIDITWDFSTTPVNSSDSPVSSDYSGTRFVVKRMQSSELQQLSSTSSSCSKVDKSPSQSPKSVKFVVEKESPVKSPTRKSPKAKSPKKNSNCGLTKSITTDEMSKLLEYNAKELFSPISQDSFPSKEDIELPTLKGDKRGEETSDEEVFVIKPNPSKVPLLARKTASTLSDSETDLLNKTEAMTSIDVRGPEGRVTTMSVAEIPTTPLSTTSPSEGTSTVNRDERCKKCILNSTLAYIIFLIGFIVGAGIVSGIFYSLDYTGKGNSTAVNQTNGHLASALSTSILKLATKLNYVGTSVDEPLTTELPTTTDESSFSTIQETEIPTITTNIGDAITETTTNTASIDLPNTGTHN